MELAQTLCIYVTVVQLCPIMGQLKHDKGLSLTLLTDFDTHSLYQTASSIPNRRGFSSTYCSLLWQGWLVSTRDCLFFEEKWRSKWGCSGVMGKDLGGERKKEKLCSRCKLSKIQHPIYYPISKTIFKLVIKKQSFTLNKQSSQPLVQTHPLTLKAQGSKFEPAISCYVTDKFSREGETIDSRSKIVSVLPN